VNEQLDESLDQNGKAIDDPALGSSDEKVKRRRDLFEEKTIQEGVA